MLYFVCPGAFTSGPEYSAFNEPLSSVGIAQATQVSEFAKCVQVQYIVSAPNRKSMDTTAMYRASCRFANIQCRSEVHYELLERAAPHSFPAHLVTNTEIDSYGMNRQSVYGDPPMELETELMYHRRVIDWYTNQFFPKFETAPVATMVLADPDTIAVMIYYILRNEPYAHVRDIVANLKAGSVMEFRSDGMQIIFSRQII